MKTAIKVYSVSKPKHKKKWAKRGDIKIGELLTNQTKNQATTKTGGERKMRQHRYLHTTQKLKRIKIFGESRVDVKAIKLKVHSQFRHMIKWVQKRGYDAVSC